MATLILLGVDLFVFIGSSTAFGRNLEGFLGAASLFRMHAKCSDQWANCPSLSVNRELKNHDDGLDNKDRK